MLMLVVHFGMYICGIILMRCLWPPRLPFSVINRCHLEWWFECVTKDGINNFWIVEFQIVKFHILASTLVLLDLWSCRTFGLAGPSVFLPELWSSCWTFGLAGPLHLKNRIMFLSIQLDKPKFVICRLRDSFVNWTITKAIFCDYSLCWHGWLPHCTVHFQMSYSHKLTFWQIIKTIRCTTFFALNLGLGLFP